MKTGRVAEYEWVESDSFPLDQLLQAFPAVVVGKCVVITSFDSGPLQATSEELEKSWEQRGDIVIAPHINSPDELPFDLYDEWYVYSVYSRPNIKEVFVNYLIFSLEPPDQQASESAATVTGHLDPIKPSHSAERLRGLQAEFWQQMSECAPESFIANGDQRLIFVSNNEKLFRDVIKAIGGR